MNIARLFLLSLVAITVNAQTTLNQNLITFPVSPEAARLGNYGNVPVNLFYGQLDKTVELFTGQVGDFRLPVNLSYNYAGFRVEETPSIVGLGWQLSCGGVVTREVRGFPDEHPGKGYYGAGQAIIGDYFSSGDITDSEANSIINGETDSEADKYTVSVNGINFSFKIGLDGNPCFLSKHNYKLEIIRTAPSAPTSFILTDTSGNKYYFGDRETNSRVLGFDNVFDDNFTNYTSSWQLSKIVVNNNDEILFKYDTDVFYSYNFYANGLYRGANPYMLVNTYGEGATKDQITRKILKTITCKNFSLLFSTTVKNGQDVYNKLTVTSRDDTDKNPANTVSVYDFTYADTRNTLTHIDKNSIFYYGFDYISDGSAMPGFISSITESHWNQDKWGFANGADNVYGVDMPLTEYTANREPSFDHTRTGALKKITYPTGGYSEIFYEQNTISTPNLAEADLSPNVRIHINFESDNTPSAPLYKEYTFTKTFTEDVRASLKHKLQKYWSGSIQLIITRTPGCPAPVYGFPYGDYYNEIPALRNYFNGIDFVACPKLNQTINDGCTTTICIENGDSGGDFMLAAGTYEFKFISELNRYEANGEATLDFYDPSIVPDTPYYNKLTGGIRVNKTVDHPGDGPDIIKYYNYNDDANISTAREYSSIIEENPIKEVAVFSSFPTSPTAIEYNARSYNLQLKRGIPVYYTRVREATEIEEVTTLKKIFCSGCSGTTGGSYTYGYIGGPFYETVTKYPKGYKETTFEVSGKPANPYPFSPAGDDLSLGRENKNEVYSLTGSGNTYTKQFSENYIYFSLDNSDLEANSNYPKSLRMGYKYKRVAIAALHPIPSGTTLETFFIFDVYKESDAQSLLQVKHTKEYYDGDYIDKMTSMEYDAKNQLHHIGTNGGDGLGLGTEILYPYDCPDITCTNMVSANSISQPIQIINTRNGEITDSYKYDFTHVAGNLYKPSTFFKSKGDNDPENRTTYVYDDKGNITMQRNTVNIGNTLSTYNDANTITIWGYNKSLPIAKIETPEHTVIPSNTISNLQQLSDSGNESSLISAQRTLRASLPKAMVTTYTYKPLVGVTSITDPRGFTINYKYDTLGRLTEVSEKDAAGNKNIVSENVYHYKNQ